MIKSDGGYVKSYLTHFFDERSKKPVPLFEGVKIYEGLVLTHKSTPAKIFLVHGHQADYFNDRLWRLSRLLVRHLWKPLEMLGVHDPTSASGNPGKKESVEKNLIEWSAWENQMLIAGHTHRSVFPDPGEPLYFNDGCCVHPNRITGIEIRDGTIALVKWEVKTKNDGTMYVGRDVLEGPKKLEDYLGTSER
jgi:predicted phosphodiesterase